MNYSHDIVIIGAGIIGLCTAFQLSKQDSLLKICVLEKENTYAKHQSGHNSGVIHSGIYYKPGSLKAQNCIRGYRMLIEFCNEHYIDYEICGKLIIAAEEKETDVLQFLYDNGIANGLSGLQVISPDEIKKFEPKADGVKAIFVPQTGIIDFKKVCKKLFELTRQSGVDFFFNEEVNGIKTGNKNVKTFTEKNTFDCSILISCAGLYSDRIAQMTNTGLDFKVIPFRGEYYKLKDESKPLVKNLIYPVPDKRFPFLGVHFTRRIDGVIEAGPNAALSLKREGYAKTDFNIKDAIEILSYEGFQKVFLKYWKTGLYEFYRSFSKKGFVKSLQRLIPSITGDDITEGGSGVRAQAIDNRGNIIDDFLFEESERIIHVCNAPSPAATSSLSIGDTLCRKVLNKCVLKNDL